MSYSMTASRGNLPSWFRQELPDPEALQHMRSLLRATGLHTVCEGARCPNLGQCWSKGAATFMILGDTCTRACRFCAVKQGKPSAVSADEPGRVAEAVRTLGLRYVVITSVTRDDLPDQGARQFAETVGAIRALSPETRIEVLVPDFSGRRDLFELLLSACPDVVGHNIETVGRLSLIMRPQADYDRSLKVLAFVRAMSSEVLVKSGLMVGLGETDEEVLLTFDQLRDMGCDMATIGQYLAPTRTGRHVPVARFVRPETFVMYKEEGMKRGLKYVMAGPLVRSSYLAEEGYEGCLASKEGMLA